MQRGGPDPLALRLPPGTDLGVRAGEAQVVQGCADVQAGPADQDRDATGGADRGEPVAGQLLVLGDRGGPGDRPHVEQVVGDPAPLGVGDLGGADVHAPVQLHGVGVDDLPPTMGPLTERESQRHRQVRLAGRRRTHDRHHGRAPVARRGPAHPSPRRRTATR